LAWLVRSGDVLATAEVVRGRRERMLGLVGRDGIDGALVIPRCRQVHTVAMSFAIDVAFCDLDGSVVRTASLRPWRISTIVWRSAFVIESESGAFERWRLTLGDVVEIKE